jgi:hypothetical protein
VADASNLFDVTFKSSERIEVGCSMHARRGFVKALDAGDLRASVPIAAFKALYDVEADCAGMAPEMRLRERQRRSRPVYDELLQWCQTYQSLEPPKSMLGAAVQYLVNQQVALTRFLDDGGLPIDNGIVERLHRRPVSLVSLCTPSSSAWNLESLGVTRIATRAARAFASAA